MTQPYSPDEVLTLVADLRSIAFDKSLDDAEGMRRIRDAFRTHDEEVSS